MQENSIIVFLGPSLSLDRARAILDVEFRPPAAMGDVYLAAQRAPSAILIIDGVFENRPAVFHKEILWALSEGIHVFGAASMGALRAAELDQFGMIGVGAIFESYRNGTLDRDDAVAVQHGPEELGYPQLSWALVDAWATFADARRDGIIDEAQLVILNAVAGTIFYKERTVASTLESAARTSGTDLSGLAAWIARNTISQKAEDASALLKTVAELRENLDTPFTATFHFEWTSAWDRLKRDLDKKMLGISDAEFAVIVNDLQLSGLYEAFEQEALTLLLAEEAAQERGQAFARADLTEATRSFRRKRQLLRATDVARWLLELDLSHADYVSMIAEHHHLTAAAERLAGRMPGAILRILRRHGDLKGRKVAVLSKNVSGSLGR